MKTYGGSEGIFPHLDHINPREKEINLNFERRVCVCVSGVCGVLGCVCGVRLGCVCVCVCGVRVW